MAPSSPPHVVIVGGGFAGLHAARALKREPVRITLLDLQNHHLFQPLLYQVATAALNPSDVATPLRSIFRRQKNVAVLLGEAVAVDVERKRLILADDEIGYDLLVIATGATHSYFGHEAWGAYAPGLKRIDDALEIRRRVLLAFEAAEREPDPVLRTAWLNFVIIGAGPTGVELAGALAEISRLTLADDFRSIRPESARVILVEAGPRILPAYPPELSLKAQRQLERMGAEVDLGAAVTGVDAAGVQLGERRIAARTVLWAAGVIASPLARSLGVPLDRAGRVAVRPDLSVPGHEEIFVVGDLASLTTAQGKPVPGVAPAAIQQGRHVARNITRAIRGQPRLPFVYRDKGTVATIGRAAAVADLPWAKIAGWVAWWLWLVVHLFFLIGFRNRVFVLSQWAWARFTTGRGARLITGEKHPLALVEHRRRPVRSDGEAAPQPEAPPPP
jgi:NADH dehydrogenase